MLWTTSLHISGCLHHPPMTPKWSFSVLFVITREVLNLDQIEVSTMEFHSQGKIAFMRSPVVVLGLVLLTITVSPLSCPLAEKIPFVVFDAAADLPFVLVKGLD